MATEYKVLSIDQLVRSDKTKGLVNYYRHRIVTKGGINLTVDIDEDDFTPEKTAPKLLKAAQNADAILKL